MVFANTFIEGNDLVESVRAPAGNVTGVRYPGIDVAVKRLEILHEMAPQAKRIWLPYQKDYPTVSDELKVLQPAAASLGVTFHFGHSVKGVWRSGEGVSVELSNGERIVGDLVLSAIGLRPRTQIALVAGLKAERGIVVDRFLRTSDPHIYALGDAAEVEGKVLLYVLPLMAAARALAKTLAGQPTEVQYPAMPVQVKTPVCPVVVSPVLPGTPGAWEVEADGNNVKAVFKSPEGQVLGFALTGANAGNSALKMELTRQLPPILP